MPTLSHSPLPADYRSFDLRGDHYACGWELGRATEFRSVGRLADAEFAAACAAAVQRQHPPLLDEFRGYADAQARPWDDVLTHLSLNHPAGRVGGCSTLVWRAEDGHVLVARNYDFTVEQRARYLLRSGPAGVQGVLGTNGSLIGGRYDGVNAAGVCVALHLVRTDAPEWVGPGVPFHLVPRILLETCSTAGEALDRVLSMPLLHAFNYVIADEREFFAVESYPDATRSRVGDAHLVVTNHYQHPAMTAYHGRRQAANSRRRAARLEALWQARAGDPFEWGQRLLADHSPAGPLCNHDRLLSTLWAMVADLTAHRVAYCLGAPCEDPFVEMPWPARS